jgi:hypothetical protein
MKIKKLDLINENNSPLFRIMSIYNLQGQNVGFANNICAFHIGNGIILSVAHNLRGIDRLPMLISDTFFQNEIIAKIQVHDQAVFGQHYPLIPGTNQRVFTNSENQALNDQLANKLDEQKVDRRFSELHKQNCCNPYLVASFRTNAFCGDTSLNKHFSATTSFPEPSINRHTFLMEVELLDEFVNEDIAIYRIVNSHQDVIDRLPSLDVDFEIYEDGVKNYYCLQTAPFDNLGRIINSVQIEGHLDSYSLENDIFGNSYIMEGLRYLIKGYFRFGSSGSPYIIYDSENEKFKINSIQSQASFIQLSIGGKMDGNVQYVNGVASPLKLIEEQLRKRITEAE